MLVIVLLFFSAVLIIWHWKLNGYMYTKSSIGRYLKNIGNTTYAWRAMKYYFELCNKRGGIFDVNTGLLTLYVITDPDISLEISNKCFEKPYIYRFLDCILVSGLVTADVERWKRDRKLLSPYFRLPTLNSFLEVFNKRSRQFVSTISNKVGTPFYINSLLVSSLTKTSAEIAFGTSQHDVDEIMDEYAHSIESLAQICIERILKMWLHIPHIYNLSNLKKKQDKLLKNIKKTIETVLNKKNNNMMDQTDGDMTSEEFRPFVDELLIFKEQGLFKFEDVVGHANTFVVAAFDTTSSAMCFTLLLLGKHLDVQERVYQEIKEVLQDRDDVTKDDHPKLVYLNAVIKESLRLYPPSPVVLRKIDKDIKIKEFILKSGSYAALGIYGTNRSAVWGEDANNYRPERWLEPDGVPSNANAFATFSTGKRNCIGQQFSIILMKVMLVHILRRYRVHGDVDNLVLRTEVVLKPVSGHEITLELRK